MLTIEIPGRELYNEETGEFLTTKPITLRLEHSLVSLSKWESKWHLPFLDNKDKTNEQMTDYIKMMTITQNVPDEVYSNLDPGSISLISDYINDPMTATTFANERGAASREIITAEIIYYWMTAFQIPFECQKWHLNKLLTLIKVCTIKSSKPKKMSRSEVYKRNRALNEERRAQLNSKG